MTNHSLWIFDWRKLLAYSHRWLGIIGGVLFVAWFVSGIVMIRPLEVLAQRRGFRRPRELAQRGPGDSTGTRRRLGLPSPEVPRQRTALVR